MKDLLKKSGRWLAAGAAALALALTGCGGGGSAGTPVLGGGSTVALADLAIVADKNTIKNDGTESVSLTITALAAGNAALTGTTVPVSVDVDAGAIVTPASKTTDTANGQLLAKVSLVDRTSRVVNVTARSGSITKKFSFNVVDAINASKVADLSIVLSKATLANDGSEQLTAKITSLDVNRSTIGGAPVTLKIVDVGDAFVQAEGGAASTDASTGQLSAKVTLGNNHTNRSVSLQVVSGTVSRTVSFDIVDAPAGSTPATAADMSLVLNKFTVSDSGLEVVEATLTAVDGNRNAAAGVEVVFKVSANAVVVPKAKVTDSNGVIKADVTIGADRSNRQVTVTASSKTLTRAASFTVTGAKLQATAQPSSMSVGDAGTVEFRYTDVNGNAIGGYPIIATGPGTATGTGTTNDSGIWIYKFTAAGSGSVDIKGVAGDANTAASSVTTATATIQVNAGTPAASVPVASATFTASPNVIAVNPLNKSDNRSELRLLFRGASNVPIQNVRARFGFGDNVSGTDAKISSGADQVVVSDASGIAAVSLIAGQRPSPTEQLNVYVCYKADDTVESIKDCPPQRKLSVALTIVEQPVSVTIGTDGTIGEGANKLTYTQDFTVLVVDASGSPKSNVQITPVIDLLQYAKGQYEWDNVNKKWFLNKALGFAECANEDSGPNSERNGTIEPGEDINNNGQLDPRKSDVSIYMVGSTKTDSNGLGVLRIEYPKSVGSWVEFSIKVSASGVSSPAAWWGRMPQPGAPGTLFGAPRWVPVPLSILKSEADPPFRFSPYGQTASCTNPN